MGARIRAEISMEAVKQYHDLKRGFSVEQLNGYLADKAKEVDVREAIEVLAPNAGSILFEHRGFPEELRERARAEQIIAWQKSELRGMLNFIKWVIKGEIWEPLKQKTTQFAQRAWSVFRRSNSTR